MQGYEVFTPAITRGFGLGQLGTVLKSAMQSAGVEGRPSVLLIEDHQITSDDILETVNSLLSAGEWRRCFWTPAAPLAWWHKTASTLVATLHWEVLTTFLPVNSIIPGTCMFRLY